MPENNKKKKKRKNKTETDYAHNARYCMILPDADDADEENVVSTGQS